MEVTGADAGGDVFCGGDGLVWTGGAGTIVDRLAAGIDTGAEAGGGDGLRPGEEIGGLLWQKATTFFLVEEEDGTGREVFTLSGKHGGSGIAAAEGFGTGGGMFGAGLDVGVETAVPENEEAEASLCEGRTTAGPGVCLRSRRGVQPVAHEAEMLVEDGQSRITGEGVAVEADELVGRGRLSETAPGKGERHRGQCCCEEEMAREAASSQGKSHARVGCDVAAGACCGTAEQCATFWLKRSLPDHVAAFRQSDGN